MDFFLYFFIYFENFAILHKYVKGHISYFEKGKCCRSVVLLAFLAFRLSKMGTCNRNARRSKRGYGDKEIRRVKK
jgi:hypothetical protein